MASAPPVCATQAASPCLYDISLVVPRGGLTVLVGRVGSGKSSLLAALLGGSGGGAAAGEGGGGGSGELPLLSGTCRTHVRRLSYVPQQPWVMAGTLRDNVLLGAPLDERLYEQVRQRFVAFARWLRQFLLPLMA